MPKLYMIFSVLGSRQIGCVSEVDVFLPVPSLITGQFMKIMYLPEVHDITGKSVRYLYVPNYCTFG